MGNRAQGIEDTRAKYLREAESAPLHHQLLQTGEWGDGLRSHTH